MCAWIRVRICIYLRAMPQLASYLRAIGCRAAISSDRITARLANGPGLPAPRGTFPPSSFPQFSQYSSRLRYNDNANYSITTYRTVPSTPSCCGSVAPCRGREFSTSDLRTRVSDKSFGYLAAKGAKRYQVLVLVVYISIYELHITIHRLVL